MFLWSSRKCFKWFSPFGLPHWVYLFSPCWSLLGSLVGKCFGQLCSAAVCLLLPSAGSYYIILHGIQIFFFFVSSVHVVGEMYLIVGFSTLGSERHLPSPCLILHFSQCFSQLLIVGKSKN